MVFERKGVDIVAEIGGITSVEEAMKVFKDRMDQEHFTRLSRIKTPGVLLKIANAIVMCDPEEIFVNTGSEEDRQRIRELALEKREEAKIAMENHTIHFDLAQEQARIVDRTFYIVNPGENTSVLAKSILRAEALGYVRTNMTGIARGKTLMIGFFSRGPIGAPAAIPALEITTSTYVMHSANILYRNVYGWFERIDRGIYQISSRGEEELVLWLDN